MNKVSLVPEKYAKYDPRQVLFHNPNIPAVKYAKMLNKFMYYRTILVAEKIVCREDKLLVPYCCLTWKRARKFSDRDLKVKIGHYAFFIMSRNEMTRLEKEKFDKYLEEIHQDAS